MTAEILSFETGRPAEITDGEAALVVDVEGYEGPLDLLLARQRQQKIERTFVPLDVDDQRGFAVGDLGGPSGFKR